jgi:hypothetical protein
MANEKKVSVSEELEALELEERRFRVRQLRSQESARHMRQQTTEQTLRSEAILRRQTEDGCAHRKGGKGQEMWFQGNDQNYAVVKHVLSHGPMIVVCQRCPKVWKEPPPLKRGATPAERAEHKRQHDEFVWAANLPTDNTTSGTALYMTFPAPPTHELATV